MHAPSYPIDPVHARKWDARNTHRVTLVKVSDLTRNQRITYAYYANNGSSKLAAIRLALKYGG